VTRTDRSRGAPAYAPREIWPKGNPPPDQTATARRLALDDRKERFEELNKLAQACGDAWLTSICGDVEVMVECLPGSTMPERLQALDYRLRPDGEGERIIPHAIVETILAEDGKKPIRKVTHAGITRVQRYSFLL
jgi:hypothetical protein